MLVVHDCLKILKYLSLNRPLEEKLFGLDNLLFQDGRLKMSDPYLSRKHLRNEISSIKRAKFNEFQGIAPPQDLLSSTIMGDSANRFSATYSQKMWQLQNLQFIGELACQLLADKPESEPSEMLKN